MRTAHSEVIAITETWRKEGDQVPGAITARYVKYETQRPLGKQGGGVLLLIDGTLVQWESTHTLQTENVQVASCAVRLWKRQTGVLCIYRAPLTTDTENEQLLQVMTNFTNEFHHFIIMGDFNLPKIDWETRCASDNIGRLYVSWLRENGLAQHVTRETRHRGNQRASLLDLIITRFENDIGSVCGQDPVGKSDHEVLTAQYTCRHPKPPAKLSRCYHKLNPDKLVAEAGEMSWIPSAEDPSVEDRWDTIKSNLTRLKNRHIPLTKRKHAQRPPWWNPTVERAIKHRRRSWWNYKKTQTHSAWLLYKKQRNATQNIQRQAKYNHELNIALKAKENPKVYYAYAQSSKKERQSVGVLELEGGTLVTEDRDRADTFEKFFNSVFRETSSDCPSIEIPDVPPEGLQTVDITVDEVELELSTLNIHKSAGPDDIHPALLRPLARVLTPPVTELFNASLKTGKLPEDWRTATVVPIFKSGSKKQAKNYRPVSLTSVLCKCVEKIIRRRMTAYMTANGLLCSAQHGFLARKSCLTNLLSFLDEVTKRLDEGIPVKVCYLDFSKAFDSVNHTFLLKKLETLGVTGTILPWICHFIRDRTLRVRVGDSLSKASTPTSGVPQGSVLGPLLFLIFINDLVKGLSNPSFIFADDVKITGKDLNEDIEKLREWSRTWDLPLNESKCTILARTEVIDEEMPFQVVQKMRDLGVIITSDFKNSAQCQNASTKAYRELFRLKNTLTCKSPEVFMPLYKSIVRPHLEYCVQAWAPHLTKDIELLEKVQRRATNMVQNMRGLSYADRLKSLNLFSLKRRRMRGDLIETYKITHGFSGLKLEDIFNEMPRTGTRGHDMRLERKHSRLDVRNKFFSVRVIPAWNKLPQSLIDCNTVNSFKHLLDKSWDELFPKLL